MTNPVLSLFQLCDSNFPTGAFSHSYGLETYIQEGTVNNQATFSKWLDVYLNEQLIYADGLVSSIAYEALEENQLRRRYGNLTECWRFKICREKREKEPKVLASEC